MSNILEVFWRFFALGLVSFGGPAAHIGYFQRSFVEKLKWIDAQGFSRLLALSQFLPGPGSSQLGFALGLRRAGLMGGVAAFVGFTTPSFVLLYLLAVGTGFESNSTLLLGLIYGLKLLAVVVVADATLSMFKFFCREWSSISLAVMTALSLLFMPGLGTQMGVIVTAAALGMLLRRSTLEGELGHPKVKRWPLYLFALLLIALPMLVHLSELGRLFATFFYSGSLVFGGGHVVLPLLQETVGDAVSTDRFLMGYAAAQAIPGPMFSFASFLGADMLKELPLLGAFIATLGIFLPGFLLILALGDGWESLSRRPRVAGMVWGINAAVVGLLFSALCSPVFVSSVHAFADMALVIFGVIALRVLKLPLLFVVFGFAALGLLVKYWL